MDFGTNSDPIPQGVTAELVVNASATPANNKYQISQTVNGVSFRFCGAPKTRNAFLTATVSAGATSIQVTDASGWVVGDTLIIEQPTVDVVQVQTVTITSISGTTIGVSAVTLARDAGLAVSNLSCNVLIRSQVDNLVSTHYLQVSSTAAPSALVEVRNCEIRNIGYLYLNWNSGNTVPPANPATFDGCYLNSTTNANSMIGSTFGSLGMPFQNCVLVGNTGYTQQNLIHPNNSSLSISNCVFYNIGSNAFSGALGYNGLSELTATNCRFNGYWNNITIANANSHIYTNCRFRSKNSELFSATLCNVQTMDCDFGTPGSFKYLKSYGNSGGIFSMQNPIVDDVNKTNPNATYGAMKIPVYSINGAFTANRFYTYNTFALNQSAVVNRATNNIALKLNNSQTSGQYAFTFQGVAGVSQRIVGYLRHDTTYGTSNPPSISFSGAGVSGSFTSSSTVNIWEKFDITVTPTSTGTVTATVNFAGAANGTAYLDGVFQFPFITESWIYGFQKLAQVNSVVDPNITLSESAVAALTSLATYDDVHDAATYSAVVAGPTAGAYTVIATPSGTVLDFGSNTVAINSAAASAFAYSAGTATLKASALTVGLKFKTLKAPVFTLANAIGAGALVGNVTQATPTARTNVTIDGDLTHATNTPTTITMTGGTVTGTNSNTGTALVTVRLAGGATIGTVGANVVTQIVTAISITGLTAGSSIYIADATGTQVDYVASSGTSYTLDTTGGTGTWIYKVRRYGYLDQSGTFAPAASSASVPAIYIADTQVADTLGSVLAYADLASSQQMYDYSRYWSTTAAGIAAPQVLAKAYGLLSASAALALDPAATKLLAYDGTTVTTKTSALLEAVTLVASGAFTSGAGLATTVAVRASNLDSELLFAGVSGITLYATLADALINANAGPSSTSGIVRFLYGATTLGLVMAGTVYVRITMGNTVEVQSLALMQGTNSLDLSTTTLLQSIIANVAELPTLPEIEASTSLAKESTAQAVLGLSL